MKYNEQRVKLTGKTYTRPTTDVVIAVVIGINRLKLSLNTLRTII